MPGVARAEGIDKVFSLTGTGKNCGSPMTNPPMTGPATCAVYVDGYPVVRKDDVVSEHHSAGCGIDVSVLTTYSGTVFVGPGGKNIGRIGDQYTPDNTIITGSSTVFCG